MREGKSRGNMYFILFLAIVGILVTVGYVACSEDMTFERMFNVSVETRKQ
ncbi:hypothetical protein ACFL08_03960 [Patescibacteria group bacterium]